MLPREKMAKFGARELDDHELLSVILSSGNASENVFDISRRIMDGFDREQLIHERDLVHLKQELRIGTVHTARIMAAMELGKRLFGAASSRNYIRNHQDLYSLLHNMQFLKKEYLRGLYLNTRNVVIRNEIISIGSLDANIIHPREIFKPAIEYSAYSIVIAHNHPSGDSSPSEADISITKKLVEIGNMLQIPILDHIIIGEESYYSFDEQGLI
jgi:DNA repair protein RadC